MTALTDEQVSIITAETWVDPQTVLAAHADLERLAGVSVTAADTMAYLLQPEEMRWLLDARRRRSWRPE